MYIVEEINEDHLHNEDFSNDAGRKEVADEDIGIIFFLDYAISYQIEFFDMHNKLNMIDLFLHFTGNFCSDMTFLFLEETEVTIGKSKPVDGFNPDSNARDSQEVVKDQMDKHESAAKEATFRDGICCSGLNQPLWGNKSKGPGVEAEEADGLYHLDDNVGTAEDFTKVTDSETSNVVSTSIAKTAGDCPATSPVTCSSNPRKF